MNQDFNAFYVGVDQTVAEWLAKFELDPTFTASLFLSFKLSKLIKLTNLDRITVRYKADELKALENKLPADVIIKAGTSVGMPNSAHKRVVARSTELPDIYQFTDFSPFIARELKRLMDDPKFYAEVRDNRGQSQGRIDHNDITVFVWIRAVNDWYNISGFVDSITTSVVKGGAGTFSMSLLPVGAVYENGVWFMDKLKGYRSGSVRDDLLATSNISKLNNENDAYLVREDHFFDRVLAENDLVYIKFEKLAMEKEIEFTKGAMGSMTGDFGPNDIPGNVYDMIGLIDSVTSSHSSSDLTTGVKGRDLMKVLIEDGSIFLAEQIAQSIFPDPNTKLARRNMIELLGQTLINTGWSFKPITTILKFIFNKFSNLGMVPSYVFSGYGDRATRGKFQLSTSATLDTSAWSETTEAAGNVMEMINKEFLNQERQGVWTIIDLVFDYNSGVRVMADNTISTDSGSILNSIRKICQEPFVEFDGDTYGDKYNFIVRKKPFDEKGYKGIIYGDVISEDELDGTNVLNDGRAGITGKIGSAAKTVQSKLTSVKTLASRAQQGIQQAKRKLERRAGVIDIGRPTSLSNLVVDIDEADVIGDALTYSNEVYSWYRLIPRGFGVNDNTTSFLLSPAIPLDEYAEIWGNKVLSIEYNYCPASFLDDSFKLKEYKYAEAQAFLDLQYIVQSHAYLPFTRQGTIRINGNRTIRKGMCVYYKPTDEVFYVDAVTNVRTATDRYTALNVSRGMREKYIKGVWINFNNQPKLVSYFTIVPTKIKNNASTIHREFLKNWKVDKDVFNFFVNRKQWAQV